MKTETLASFSESVVELLQDAPTAPEILADIQFADDHMERGAFADYPGDYVAILNSEVVGWGNNESELRRRLSREKNVPESRFVVEFKSSFD